MPLFPNHGFQKPDLRVFEFLNRQLTVQEKPACMRLSYVKKESVDNNRITNLN